VKIKMRFYIPIVLFFLFSLISCSKDDNQIEIDKIGLNNTNDILYFSVSEYSTENLRRNLIYFDDSVLLDTLSTTLFIDTFFLLPRVQYNTLISVKILDGDKVLFKKEMVIEQDRAFFGVKLNSFIGLILILWVLTLVIPPSILFSNSIKSWKLGLSIFLFVSPLIFGLIASIFIINSMVYGVSQYHISQYALILLCFFIVVILSRFLYKLLFQKKILL
jgi:hypothetical protein